MISKELFEAIKGFTVEKYEVKGNIVEADGNTYLINDLFFEGKKWAWKMHGVFINSMIDYDGKGYASGGLLKSYIKAHTEQEAVFKHIEWILDKKGE